MKRFLLVASALFVCGVGVAGCGPKDESSNTPTSAAPGADKMGTPAPDKMGASSSTDAVKDKVEAALKADDKLKAVTVEHKDGKVILKGSVADNAAKKEAGDNASKAISDAGSTDKVQNMITAKSH
jgi:hypothetical protein